MTIPWQMLAGQGTGIAQGPNVGLQIGQIASQLGKSVQGIMDPNYDLQKHMQVAMAENPELAQSLSDRAFMSDDPKFLQKMGLGGQVEGQVRGIPPSPTAQMTKQIMHKIGPEGTKGMQGGLDDLQPEEKEFFYKHMLGVEDPQDVATRRQQATAAASTATSNATTAGNNAQVSTAQTPGDIQTAQDHINYLQNPATPQELTGMVNDINSGKLDNQLPPRTLQILRNDPAAKEVLTQTIAARRANQEQGNKNREYNLQATREDISYAEAQDRNLAPIAKDAYTYSKIGSALNTLQGVNGTAAAKAAASNVADIMSSLSPGVRPQLRSQMYGYMKKLSPALADQAASAFDLNFQGTYPPALLKGVQGFFAGQANTVSQQYRSRAEDVWKRYPAAKKYMMDPDVVLKGLEAPGGAPPQPTSSSGGSNAFDQ